jgi:hypothetical protein
VGTRCSENAGGRQAKADANRGGVLDEYVEQLPLTLRQIFYILVGRHAYEKTERAYERLCERLNKAHRAKVVDMDAVRDDGFTNEIPNFLGSANHFLNAVRVSARLLRLDRQAGQTRRLALWCEASGMVPHSSVSPTHLVSASTRPVGSIP